METVTRRTQLPAPPETVWAELTDPEAVAAWLGELETVVRRGHQGRIQVDGVIHQFVAEVVDPPHRLAWRWWPVDASDPTCSTSSVEFTLELVDGGTRLEVTERPAPRPAGFRPLGSVRP